MPSCSRKPYEGCVLGVAEPLGHRGDRQPGSAGPGPGQVPVAAVGQGHDHPRRAYSARSRASSWTCTCSTTRVAGQVRQGQDFVEGPQVRPDGGPGEVVVHRLSGRDRQIVPQPPYRSPVPPHHPAADGGEHRPGQRAAGSGRRRPSRRGRRPCDQSGPPAQPSPAFDLLVDVGDALAHRDHAGQRPGRPSRVSSTYGTPNPASSAPSQEHQQAVGAGGQSPVSGVAEALGPGPDVGGELPEDQRHQRHRGPDRLVPESAKYSRMPPNTAASPSRSRVESRKAPQARGRAAHLGHLAVEHVGQAEERDQQRALPQPTLRKADQGRQPSRPACPAR